MQELIKIQKLMSSKQIAERTGKQHSNVLRDIRNMLEDLSKSQDSILNPNEYQEVIAQNSMTSEILLNERLSLCLASGYSVLLRMGIIDDWAKMKVVSRKELAQMVVDAEEANERLQLQNQKLEVEVKALAPKAEYLDTVLKSVDNLTTTSVASELGMTAQKLNKELLTRKIQRKIDKHYVLTANYVNKGYANNRTHSHPDSKGVIHTSQLLVWTEYGKAFLHSLFNQKLSFSKSCTLVTQLGATA